MKTRNVWHYVMTVLCLGATTSCQSSTPPDATFPTLVTYTYKVVQDHPIKLDVYRPAGDGIRPVIIFIHGGALINGSRASVTRNGLERYLAAGYAVVSIDYRLAPETKALGIIEDLRDAFAWVRKKGPARFQIDPDRLAVVGHSAGGYLTLMSGFAVSPRPQVLVSFFGYGDVAGAWYSEPDPFYRTRPLVEDSIAYSGVGGGILSSSDQGLPNRRFFYLYTRQNGIWPDEVVGHDPGREPEAFDPFCPIRNVTADYPPTLFLHGDQDTDVPYEQSVMMAEALDNAGVEHELITISGGGHGLGIGRYFQDSDRDVVDSNVPMLYDQVLAFLERHLQ